MHIHPTRVCSQCRIAILSDTEPHLENIELDVECGGGACGRRESGGASPRPRRFLPRTCRGGCPTPTAGDGDGAPGPNILDEVLSWAPPYLQHLRVAYPDMYQRVLDKLSADSAGPGGDANSEPLVVVTDYSGMGCAELAIMEITKAFGNDSMLTDGAPQQVHVEHHRAR